MTRLINVDAIGNKYLYWLSCLDNREIHDKALRIEAACVAEQNESQSVSKTLYQMYYYD